MAAERRHLCDQEARVAFRQSAQLAGQNHLQHVSMEPLHDDEDVIHRLKHVLQQDHTEVRQVLGNTFKSTRLCHKQGARREISR